jgi:alcohol dehydrogenase class IV
VADQPLTGWSARPAPELRVGRGVLAESGRMLASLGIRRPLLVTDPGVAAAGWPDRVVAAGRAAGVRITVWDGVRAGPRAGAVDRCRDAVLGGGHDGLVAVGGGSVLDVAKACSGLVPAGGSVLDHERLDGFTAPGPPVVAVPTTPGGGAEVSGHAVIAAGTGRRFAVSGRWLVPRAVLADPDTLITAPAEVALDTVLDALLHAIEAYLARAATPLTDLLARAAVALLGRSAVPALATGTGRTDLVTGCLAAGLAMANANATAVHALGYPLTSEYGIPHGRANALVAVPALRAIAAAEPDRCAELARLFADPTGRGADPPGGLAGAVGDLFARLGVRPGLASYGVPADALPRLAGLAATYRPVLRNCPVELTETDLCELYELAWPAEEEER